MKQTLFLLAAFALAAPPAGVPGFAHWSAAELKNYGQQLAPKLTALKAGEVQVASQPLGDWGNHNSSIALRRSDGEAEVHEKVVDYFVAEGGEAVLVVGGKVLEPRSTGPGETRGKAIAGGSRHPLRPGDVVHIPANTPHQLLVAKEFLYYMIKVKQ